MKSGILGAAIRAARIEKHFSQEMLAEKVGITPTHMKHIESEHRKPSVEVLFSLVRVLNLSLDNIIFPQNNDGQELRQEIIRRLNDCDGQQLKVISATIEAMLDKG